MTKEQAKKRIDELNKLTQYYAKKYYDDDKPEISDFEYDMLMVELRNLEKDFPEFISKNSLTQKVGGTVKEGFEKVTHEVPLQSLQDVFNYEELESFDERVKKNLEVDDVNYVVETNIKNLDILLAGKDLNNQEELLESYKMKDTLKLLENLYDVVIIDSDNALESANTLVISKLVKGAILVVSERQTNSMNIIKE